MLLIELRHGRTKYLFNGRAYIPVNSSDKELLEFEKELENIGDEYITFEKKVSYIIVHLLILNY